MRGATPTFLEKPVTPISHSAPQGGASLGFLLFAALLTFPVGVEALDRPDPREGDEVRMVARVWLDRGADAVLQSGDRVRIYYRVNADAHVALFHLDTNGFLRLLAPAGPGDGGVVQAERDYRLLLSGDTYWAVEDPPGVGYFFLVASPVPLDFRRLGYSPLRGGWDLSPVGARVNGDPHEAMHHLVATLLPEWEWVDYGFDFATYHVGQTYSFPRFLCYDCHGYEPFRSWNPYHSTCLNFRVVIYNDPYFYPATRYQANQVVFTRPPDPGVPQFSVRERARGEAGTPVIQTRAVVEGEGSPDRIWLRSEDEIRSFIDAWRTTYGSSSSSPGRIPEVRDERGGLPGTGFPRSTQPGRAAPVESPFPRSGLPSRALPSRTPVIPDIRVLPDRVVPERRPVLERRPEPNRPGGGDRSPPSVGGSSGGNPPSTSDRRPTGGGSTPPPGGGGR